MESTENKVTLAQVNALFAFVRQKYVHYIDVQHELVDHLASAIEDEWKRDSRLSFNDALAKVYGQFPVTGFAQLVRSKEKNLSRQFYRHLRQCFGYYLLGKKSPIFIGITFLWYSILQLSGKNGFFIAVLVLQAIFFIQSQRYLNKLKKQYKDLDKILLLQIYTLLPQLWISFFCQIFAFSFGYDIYSLTEYHPLSPLGSILFAMSLGLFMILYFITFTEIPYIMNKNINKNYTFLKST